MKGVPSAATDALEGRYFSRTWYDFFLWVATTISVQSGTGTGSVTGPGTSTDNAVARFDGAGGETIQNSGVIIDDSNNVAGIAALSAATIELGASDTTLARSSAGNVSIEGNVVYRAGGTDVPVADGGTGVSTLTAYAPIFGGTTGTGAVQSGTVGTAGQVMTSNGAGALPTFQAAAGGKYTRGASWRNNGAVLVAASADITYIQCQNSGTITKGTVLTDGGTGSCAIEVWKDTYANYPPTVADKISASAPLTVTAGIKSVDTTLTGWTLTVTAGDILAFELTSSSTFTWVSVQLEVT